MGLPGLQKLDRRERWTFLLLVVARFVGHACIGTKRGSLLNGAVRTSERHDRREESGPMG